MLPSQTHNLRIAFFGTSAFAVPFLDALIRSGQAPELVITKPDKPQGRHQELVPCPVKQLAQEHDLPVYQPVSLKKDYARHRLMDAKPDISIVVAYGKIIPQDILDIPRLKTLNVHPSLLPKYRGPSPIQAAIMNGDSQTGISVMILDADMDHGPILAQKTHQIAPDATSGTLHHSLALIGAPLLISTISAYTEGSITPKEQDHDQATFSEMLTRDHGKIDWNRPALEIERKIRALTPWPGCFTTWNGKRLKVLSTSLHEDASCCQGDPGNVSSCQESIAVSCNQGCLLVHEAQLEGKRPMDAKDIINGHPDIIGARFE